jgi:cellulose synthase/poly-beta-1,6-N-acetylglucosamine synthase-like glycosyltransferase
MRVSLIVSTYKDTEALSLIFEALKRQSHKDFEVVVAEDDNSKETKELIKKESELNILHVSHEDIKNRKTVIQNRAIKGSSGEYLIFIDGDVIPYRDFIKNQLFLARKKRVLSGRRVNLPQNISKLLRSKKLKAATLERFYLFFALYLMFDRSVRFEQGISLNPQGFIYQKFLKNRKRNSAIIGCNFSCFKEDFVAINGFDDSYTESRLGDDTDLTWRFKAAGYELISSKNLANIFHLHHEKISLKKDFSKEIALMQERKEKNLYYCEHGLDWVDPLC